MSDKSFLIKVGHFWWRLNDTQRNHISRALQTLAVMTAAPIFIVPAFTDKVAISKLFFLLIYAVIFLVLSILALTKKEHK